MNEQINSEIKIQENEIICCDARVGLSQLEEDLTRINYLKEKGIAVFAMPYNKADPYQMHFSRWINRYFYKYETFEEYLSKKALIAEVITNGR